MLLVKSRKGLQTARKKGWHLGSDFSSRAITEPQRKMYKGSLGVFYIQNSQCISLQAFRQLSFPKSFQQGSLLSGRSRITSVWGVFLAHTAGGVAQTKGALRWPWWRETPPADERGGRRVARWGSRSLP